MWLKFAFFLVTSIRFRHLLYAHSRSRVRSFSCLLQSSNYDFPPCYFSHCFLCTHVLYMSPTPILCSNYVQYYAVWLKLPVPQAATFPTMCFFNGIYRTYCFSNVLKSRHPYSELSCACFIFLILLLCPPALRSPTPSRFISHISQSLQGVADNLNFVFSRDWKCTLQELFHRVHQMSL
jgi:hypothetical protein